MGQQMKKYELIILTSAILFNQIGFEQMRFDKVEIKTTKVAEDLYMLKGEGGNIGVSYRRNAYPHDLL